MVRGKGRKGFHSSPNSSHFLRTDVDVNAYSLQQEALNTEKRDADWFVQTQLRSRHVLFVSAGSHATTESFSSLFKNQEPLGLTNSKANAPVVDLQTHVTVEQGVSKSLADLDISKSRKVSSADPSAPSPTSSSISSSDEIVFIGKDPIARQHVITETAGWDFAGATTISTPTAIKSLVGNPKDNNDGDGDSVDDDEAILRDYIENVGGFDGLRGDLDGGISQFGFLGRRLDIGEESGPEELHVGTRNMAYQIQKDELFEGKPATFEKFDRDSTPDDEDEIPEFGRSYRSSFFPASLAKTTGEETAMQSDGSAITRTALSQSLIDLVGAPGSNFDVMDRSRPSLQLRSKKGALAMPPHLSDAEFQESMTEALETDRQKKKARKGEREALRKQGLLGKSKPDLKEKYEDGMNLDQIKQEFIQFCKSPHQNQSLPPMGKEERKIVHELAATFGLKSKSTGNGNTRYVTLVKTRRTRAFDESTWAHLEQRIRRKYFPRLDNRAKGNIAQSRGAFGSSDASAKYRDGDIVGGTAPEIAASNRGRGMLEKMGWSSGMALGSSNNGILQPIQHIVRNSRAGLG